MFGRWKRKYWDLRELYAASAEAWMKCSASLNEERAKSERLEAEIKQLEEDIYQLRSVMLAASQQLGLGGCKANSTPFHRKKEDSDALQVLQRP